MGFIRTVNTRAQGSSASGGGSGGGTGAGDLSVTALNYTAFGAPTEHATSTRPTEYAFTGQMRDGVIGLQYHRARWYEPTVAGWASSDSCFDFPRCYGAQLSYCGSNPIFWIDATGNNATLSETVFAAAMMGGLTETAFGAAGMAISGKFSEMSAGEIVTELIGNFVMGFITGAIGGALGHYATELYGLMASMPNVVGAWLAVLRGGHEIAKNPWARGVILGLIGSVLAVVDVLMDLVIKDDPDVDWELAICLAALFGFIGGFVNVALMGVMGSFRRAAVVRKAAIRMARSSFPDARRIRREVARRLSGHTTTLGDLVDLSVLNSESEPARAIRNRVTERTLRHMDTKLAVENIEHFITATVKDVQKSFWRMELVMDSVYSSGSDEVRDPMGELKK